MLTTSVFSLYVWKNHRRTFSSPFSFFIYTDPLSISASPPQIDLLEKVTKISSIPTPVPSSALGNMKQKIVMKVQMNCQKCRTKAMEVAACTHGVISVAVEGDNKEKVVVTGDGIDPVDLAKDMRKKVGHTSIISVEEVKEKKEEKKEEPKIEYCHQYYSRPYACEVYDDNPSCSIM